MRRFEVEGTPWVSDRGPRKPKVEEMVSSSERRERRKRERARGLRKEGKKLTTTFISGSVSS